MAPNSGPPKSKPAWIAPSGSTIRLSNTTPTKPAQNITPITSPTSTRKIGLQISPASQKTKARWIPAGNPKTIVKDIDLGDKARQRARLIRDRLLEFERNVIYQKCHSLWPRGTAVSLTQEQLYGRQAPSLLQDVNQSSPELSMLPPPLAEGAKKLEEFTLFVELPVELRLLVWGFAARLPKSIEIRYFAINYDWRYIQCGNPCNLTMVCRESRYVANRVKESEKGASLGMHRHNKELQMKHISMPYNPHRDTIFFRPLDMFNLDHRMWSYFQQLQTIQHIAIPLDQGPDLDPLNVLKHEVWRGLLRRCVNVESITLVLGCGEVSWKSWGAVEARRLENWAVKGKHQRKGLEWNGKRINVADLRGK